MKVLITGATGLLGTHLLRSIPSKVNVTGTVHIFKKTLSVPQVKYCDLDIKDRKAVLATVKLLRPDVIIHTAAHTSVDFCENNKDEAYATNIQGIKNIISAAKKYNSKIIFCSTNMTYDGLTPLYDEKSKQKPGSYYGQTKVKGEALLIKSGVRYTIVRLMTMYGWNWQPNRQNMISMSINKLRSNQKLWMTNDVFNNLLYVAEAAKFFWKLTLKPELSDNQKFNIAGKDCINRYQAVSTVCEVFNLKPSLVTEVSSDYFAGNEVPRSPNTCFNTTKAHEVLGFKPMSLREGLKKMKKIESQYNEK